MQDTEFSALAEQTIALIVDIIETEDQNCLIDVDFHGDIVTLITNQGTFVINKHSAAKEIWLSSPVSGPYHFSYVSNVWKSKANIDLIAILARELQIDFSKFSHVFQYCLP